MSADHEQKKNHGSEVARFRCNKCGKTVERHLGWKLWTPSFCVETGKYARLYRISAPKVQQGK